MNFKYGKKIDSNKLKKNLDKLTSIENSKKHSCEITPGIESNVCPICNSEEFEFIQEIYNFKYNQCKNCQVAYVSNMPEDNEIQKIYNSKYYEDQSKMLFTSKELLEYRIENIGKPKFEYINNHIDNSKNTWLDIGCGLGEVLKVAHDNGYNALGIETHKTTRDIATKELGLNVIDEYICENNISKHMNNYGVISLFSVLEHIKNPHSIIKNVSKIQQTDDNLVLEVPNFPSMSAYSQISYPDKVNRMMHPPLHLFLFSLKSIEILLNSYSYEITNTWFFGQDIYEILSTLSIFSDLSDTILYEKLSPFINDFQEVIDKKQLSDEMLIIARKK